MNKKINQIKVVIYGRANDRIRRDEQLKQIKVLAGREGFKVVGIFLEKSTGLKYPVFSKMLSKMKTGKVDCVVIYSLDKLPWLAMLRLEFYRTLKAKNIKLISIIGDEDVLETRAFIDAGFAQIERSNRIQAIKRGIRAKKNNE